MSVNHERPDYGTTYRPTPH